MQILRPSNRDLALLDHAIRCEAYSESYSATAEDDSGATETGVLKSEMKAHRIASTQARLTETDGPIARPAPDLWDGPGRVGVS